MTKKNIQIQLEEEERAIVPVVTVSNHQIITTSLNVADVFEKRHDNVLQATQAIDVPAEFRLLNFQESNYLNKQGKEQPMVNLTRDGLTLLVMGFTGAKAMKFKLAYIDAFNRMEKELLTPVAVAFGQLNGSIHAMGAALLAVGESVIKVDRQLQGVDQHLQAVDENMAAFAARLDDIEAGDQDVEERLADNTPPSLEEFFSYHQDDLKRVSQPVRDFIHEAIVLNPDGGCVLEWLFLLYEKRCYAHSIFPLGRNSFYDEMRIAFRGFGILRARRGKLIITGIKLRGE